MEFTPLEPPVPPQPASVPQQGDTQLVKLSPEILAKLDEKVSEFITSILDSDVQSEAFQDKLLLIHNMGNDEIRAAANSSNRMMDRPLRALNEGGMDEKAPINQSLTALRTLVETLDPSRQGKLTGPKKIFGMVPTGNKMRQYFSRYRSSQAHLNQILESLYQGQDDLRKDNAAIEQEKVQLWRTMELLQQYSYIGQRIDTLLSDKVTTIEAQDSEKARLVKEELLFYVRQKVTDLLTQLSVSIQGYLALDMVRLNNLELIKGVDRASTTTVSALRTAVMTAQALSNQKLVLDQVSALNTTTSSLIDSTSRMLKQQSSHVQQQASNATIELDKLQNSFDNIYAAMDSISDYKLKALDNLKQTVDVLNQEVSKAERYLDRTRHEQLRSVGHTLKE